MGYMFGSLPKDSGNTYHSNILSFYKCVNISEYIQVGLWKVCKTPVTIMESGDFHTGNYTCSSLTDIDDGNEFYLYSLYVVSG